MVLRQTVAQELECIFGAVDNFELVEVFRCNRAGVNERLEVEDAIPVFAAVNDDQNFFRQLVGLRQRQDFKKFVHGSEAAGKDNEGLGQIGEPEFTHEEVVKLKVQRRRDVLVGTLFEGQ